MVLHLTIRKQRLQTFLKHGRLLTELYGTINMLQSFLFHSWLSILITFRHFNTKSHHVSLWSIFFFKLIMPGLISVVLLCVNLILAMPFLSFCVNIAVRHFKWFQAKLNILSSGISVSVKAKLVNLGGREDHRRDTSHVWWDTCSF